MISKSTLFATLVAGLFITAPATAADHRVDIINKTGMSLKHFYASVTSTESWEEDILGRDVLDDGESFEADINDGRDKCKYDFKAVFENGQSVFQRNIDD